MGADGFSIFCHCEVCMETRRVAGWRPEPALWQYREDCNCDKCKEERQQMATGGKTTYGDGSVAGPEEVTTKTYTFEGASVAKVLKVQETPEERNNRIWQAIRDASSA